MLVDCDKHWKARDGWTHEKLIPRFDNNSEWRGSTVDDDNILEKNKWSQVADAMAFNKNFYIFDQLDHPAGKEVEKDYSVPAPFVNSDLFGFLNSFPPKYGSMRWFCIGRGGTGTHPHMDPYSTDAWNSIISGHKWWIIYPTSVTDEEDIECSDVCSVPDPTSRHWYASVGINAARSEYTNGERPYHVLQKPGETIYVPNGYVHSVLNMDDTVAVTANFGSFGNLDAVWQELVTESNSQHWKRAYYQVFNKEQRRHVRESYYWHPDEFDFTDSEEDDESEEYEDSGEDEDLEEDEHLR